MPSATMNKVPLGPSVCRRTSGWSVALLVVRSATTNASSLCSRVRPTSVRPNTLTTTSPRGSAGASLIARREGLLTDTGRSARAQAEGHASREPCAARDRLDTAQRPARRCVVMAAALGERLDDRRVHALSVVSYATLHVLQRADD